MTTIPSRALFRNEAEDSAIPIAGHQTTEVGEADILSALGQICLFAAIGDEPFCRLYVISRESGDLLAVLDVPAGQRPLTFD
jgi:hypothetical protein